jgi:hypothetical protein
MQKILKQRLGGNKEEAEKNAVYTWQKDEMAYYFCNIYNVVFKVQFTGEHWFILSRFGDGEKIYQYKYLDGSDLVTTEYKTKQDNGLSHRSEDSFFTTKEEALEQGIRIIERRLLDSTKDHDKQLKSLMDYAGELVLKPCVLS